MISALEESISTRASEFEMRDPMKPRVAFLLITAPFVAVTLALGLASCAKQQTVVIYVSEDQVFSEPILKDFEKETDTPRRPWAACRTPAHAHSRRRNTWLPRRPRPSGQPGRGNA